MNGEDRPRGPCPEYEEACLEAAWGEGEDAAFLAHRTGCSRCERAYGAALALAERCASASSPPPGALHGLHEAVLERTIRKPGFVAGRRWAWAGAALAAAVAAYLTVFRNPGPDFPAGLDLAEVDLDLLENLELAENLDVLEALDEEILRGLEEMDDA